MRGVCKTVGCSVHIGHGAERHLPYAGCNVKRRGAVCHRVWCGSSPAICWAYVRRRGAVCVCVCDRAWRGASLAICWVYVRRGEGAVCYRAWCGAFPAVCWAHVRRRGAVCVCVCVCM